MRIRIFILLLCGSMPCIVLSQSDYQMKSNNDYVEIDFLSGYYNQDGDNAAVTGGIGTEALTDISSLFVINIPLDSSKSINASFGADYYTSASTDMINNNRSSASSRDVRAYGNLGYNHKFLNSGFTIGGKAGFSVEYDYTSINGGLNLAKDFNYGNTELSLSAQYFKDKWTTFYPVELRGKVSVPTKNREAYNLTFTLSQVVNKNIQISITAESILMQGLLSTPFHRVYFADNNGLDIERLPQSRLKTPVSFRLNWFVNEHFVLRSFYRYYSDDFGIRGHSASLEIPIKVSDNFTISPFYRYHTQTESDYFAPFAEHLASNEFYTSDYDLSNLSSNKFGLGIYFNPLYGISRSKIPFSKKLFIINSIGLRTSYYSRDTGLKAYSIALELNMRI